MFSKHTFFVLKKKWLLIFLCVLLVLTSVVVYFTAIRPTFQPKPLRTIVIDAGHGGKDGGASGKTTGVSESQINLDYAFELKSICEDLGFKVVMTRKDENGLYSPFASNKKRSEMEKRSQIISQSGGDVLLSVHMNSFPLSSTRGAQVFYGVGNAEGKILAESIQQSLYQNIEFAKAVAKEGDYYVLNCTSMPGALIEFGFLSNAAEEKLLVQKEYRRSICNAVVNGIVSYLSF